MFTLNPWLLLGIALAIGTAGVTGYVKGGSHERARWEVTVAKQKIEAASTLAAETERVRAKERELTALSNRVETNHVEATRAIAAAGDKYNRLGLLYERTKARCGASGGSAASPDPGAPALDHGREGQPANVPGADAEDLGAVIADADLMRVTVLACQEWVRGLAQ